jgi:hypothetical protein
MAQQIRADGQAVANLTLRHLEKEDQYLSDTSTTVIYEEEEEHDLHNVFAKGKKLVKASTSKSHKYLPPNHSREPVPRNSLPKIQLPTFEGDNPRNWFHNYEHYFSMYSLPEQLWVTASAMHL